VLLPLGALQGTLQAAQTLAVGDGLAGQYAKDLYRAAMTAVPSSVSPPEDGAVSHQPGGKPLQTDLGCSWLGTVGTGSGRVGRALLQYALPSTVELMEIVDEAVAKEAKKKMAGQGLEGSNTDPTEEIVVRTANVFCSSFIQGKKDILLFWGALQFVLIVFIGLAIERTYSAALRKTQETVEAIQKKKQEATEAVARSKDQALEYSQKHGQNAMDFGEKQKEHLMEKLQNATESVQDKINTVPKSRKLIDKAKQSSKKVKDRINSIIPLAVEEHTEEACEGDDHSQDPVTGTVINNQEEEKGTGSQ